MTDPIYLTHLTQAKQQVFSDFPNHTQTNPIPDNVVYNRFQPR